MDNFPPGARYDKRAPYNEPIEPEIDVTIRTVMVKFDEDYVVRYQVHMVKKTVVAGCETVTYPEYEIEPDGSYSVTTITEAVGDIEEMYRNQEKTPIELLMALERICKQLLEDRKMIKGGSRYAGCYLPYLIDSIRDWEEEELTVEDY